MVKLSWKSGNFSQQSNFSTSLFQFIKHSSKKKLQNTAKYFFNVNFKGSCDIRFEWKRRNATTHSLCSTRDRALTITTTCTDLRIQDAFSASSVTNRLKKQTLTCVSQTRYMPYVLSQLILLVQLPVSGALLRPAPSSPEGRPHSSHQLLQKVLSRMTARVTRLHPAGWLSHWTKFPHQTMAQSCCTSVSFQAKLGKLIKLQGPLHSRLKEVKELQLAENTPCFYVSLSADPGQLCIITFSSDSAACFWDMDLWDARD